MKQDGKPMTADEFDAWMKARQVRVATGRRPRDLRRRNQRRRHTGLQARPDIQQRPAAVAAVARTAQTVTPPASAASDAVVLQVASFAARGNAERALAMLEGAGIRDVRLLDAVAAGQKVWRLRVGPVASDRIAELSATVAGLGFGRPNIVRE
jgi:rare lipoprotein A